MSWGSRPRVRDSSSAPLRVCPFTPLPRDMVLTVRDVRDPRPEPRAARHHIRRDARVWAQPKWISIALVAQQAEQPPCKRQAARSNRRRGHHQSSRVRRDGRGHHSLASPLLRSTRWMRGFVQREALDAPQAQPEQSRTRRQHKETLPIQAPNPRRQRALVKHGAGYSSTRAQDYGFKDTRVRGL